MSLSNVVRSQLILVGKFETNKCNEDLPFNKQTEQTMSKRDIAERKYSQEFLKSHSIDRFPRCRSETSSRTHAPAVFACQVCDSQVAKYIYGSLRYLSLNFLACLFNWSPMLWEDQFSVISSGQAVFRWLKNTNKFKICHKFWDTRLANNNEQTEPWQTADQSSRWQNGQMLSSPRWSFSWSNLLSNAAYYLITFNTVPQIRVIPAWKSNTNLETKRPVRTGLIATSLIAL